MNVFGWELKRKEEEKARERESFVENTEDDGAISVTAAGGSYGTYVDLEGAAKNEADLITKYRQMSLHPEVQNAVEDIINECVIINNRETPIELNLEDIKLSDRVKTLMQEEFQNILSLMDFSNKGFDIFHRWYVDGRIKYHAIIDEENVKEGIKELRYIDPRKLRKIREVEEKQDPKTQVVTKKVKNEYFIYNDRGFSSKSTSSQSGSVAVSGTRISKDSIVESSSGILNENSTLILSHLHKAMKAMNQLRMLEDASVIYRISRAPERRVFYIDVGNLPKAKAEQYLRDMMVKHKNRLVYDAATGEVRDDRKHMTMMEDFWLPRREGGKGTEIDTLAGGTNLGEMEDILYFQKNLYKALNVPVSRLEADGGFQIGRASEISRDEIKFSRFINRLRNRFAAIFDDILEKQLLIKGIITEKDWREIKNEIRYDFKHDNHFEELKNMEILRERLGTLREMEMIEGVIGTYYSHDWVRKNVLMQTETEIEEIDKEIKTEVKTYPEPKEDEE